MALDAENVQHGKRGTYIQWGCRCDECRAANTAYNRVATARRKALMAAVMQARVAK